MIEKLIQMLRSLLFDAFASFAAYALVTELNRLIAQLRVTVAEVDADLSAARRARYVN